MARILFYGLHGGLYEVGKLNEDEVYTKCKESSTFFGPVDQLVTRVYHCSKKPPTIGHMVYTETIEKIVG